MSNAGLQRLTLRTLNTNVANSVVVAVIIRAQNVRLFSSKKDGSEKGVWNLTIRDSITDYMNITCWGSGGYVTYLQQKFCVGDVVEIMRPRIEIRHIGDKNEQYRPQVTSPFTLTLNEGQSNIAIHDAENYHEYLPLLHYPTKPASSYLTLGDIHNNGGTIRGNFVDLLVAVQSVGAVKIMKAKNDGREITKRDIIVLDETQSNFRITLWENEFIKRAENWKPRETILFLADMRVDWSDFDRSMVAVPNTRTIITEDPLISHADTLRNYAKFVPIHPVAVIDSIASSIPDPSSISAVMTTQKVCDKAMSSAVTNDPGTSAGDSQQFTALLFAFVTHLDLDGFNDVVTTRCKRCYQVINKSIGLCINLECPVGSGSEPSCPETKFDMFINLTDHTGTLNKCRLAGKTAETMLGITAQQFIQMSDDEKAELKWRFLMERCAVRIFVMRRGTNSPMISVVSCELADLKEVAAKLPLY